MNEKWKTRCDNDHVGHFFVNYMRNIPHEIFQIDAATGESETCGSVLSRSVRLAQRLSALGLRPGDPVAVGGRNHLHAHIPFYAAMMAGLPMAGIDPHLKSSELKHLLRIVKPKLVFCDYAMFEEYKQAVHELSLDTNIITFGGGESSFAKLMDSEQEPVDEEKFQLATFNTDEVYCWLINTSGSTGKPKIVALTHSHILQTLLTDDFFSFSPDKNGIRKNGLNLSTVHWLSGCYNALLMPIYYVKVQTSAPVTAEHLVDIINKYKPAVTICTPTSLSPLMHHEKHCDFTCFDFVKIGGSKVHEEFLRNLRGRVRADTVIQQGYGMSETACAMLQLKTDTPFGSLGKLNPAYKAKLVDPETGKEIFEPNVPGELFLRGPTMACYYNDPTATTEAYTDDGYYKTGDLLYKDENGYYFFVERLKMLIKYKNYQIVPPEVEEVILRMAGVLEACVVGAPHAHDGERSVACVVRRAGASVSAQEIKEHVAKHLSASKHLHGGVLFLDTLPTTSTGKIARLEVKKIVLTAYIE